MKTSKAVTFFGNKTALARALGLSHQAISYWGEDVPENRVVHVETAMTLEKLYRKGVIERPAPRQKKARAKKVRANTSAGEI